MSDSNQVLKFFSFFFWAVFTYTSHFFAKQFFSVSGPSNTIEKVILITSLQVGCGAVLYLILRLRSSVPVLDHRLVLLGACHTYGMVMTNSSMAQTTASLTHLVKMSEPFYTTIIMAIIGKMKFNCKIILIMMIILVTAVGSEPISDAQSSVIGICFALASNLCYALRNIGTKYLYPEESSKRATTVDGFAALSFGGFLSLIPTWVISYFLGYNNYSSIISMSDSHLHYLLIISSVSHALYNIISLTIILSFFNPVQHAMLNVGKRISIVLVFYIFSQRPFTALNFVSALICLTVSVVSVQALSVKKQGDTNDKSDSISRKHFISGLSILILSLSSLSWVVARLQSNTLSLTSGARQNWLQCIEDIQENIMESLSDILKKQELLNHPSPLLFVDPAYGSNVGDNMIAYGELVLMERMGYLNHSECEIKQSEGRSRLCGNFEHVPDGGLAWWHGGGNWGDLWVRQELTLRRMKTFIQLAKKGKIVIGMPQSFHYGNKTHETGDATDWMKAIAAEFDAEKSKSNMVLTWRQSDSLETASSLYPLVDNRLLPDVAFMIGPLKETFGWSVYQEEKQKDIMFLLRYDKESIHKDKKSREKLRQILDSNQETKGLTFHVVDWFDRHGFINSSSKHPGPEFKHKVINEGNFDYQYMFKSSMAMYTGGKIIITDRLHASILAFLMHKPHIYVDQLYGKITKTRQIAFDVSEKCSNRDDLRFDEAESIEQAVIKAAKMLKEKQFWSD